MVSKFHKPRLIGRSRPQYFLSRVKMTLSPGLTADDRVGAGAKRRFEAGVLERVGIDGVFGQHRHQPDDQRQFAVVGAAEVEAHAALADDIGLDHLGVVNAVVGAAVVAQQLPGKHDVRRRDRLAVGKARRRIEREGDETARGIRFHALGQQAVKRERLVVATRQQALDHVIADIDGGQALDDERIEAVEGAEHALRQLAALWRRRVGIARMAEVGWPRRRAVHGDGVVVRGGTRGAQGKPGRRRRARRARPCAATPLLASAGAGRMGALAGVECDSLRFCAILSQRLGRRRVRIFGTFAALLRNEFRLSRSG